MCFIFCFVFLTKAPPGGSLLKQGTFPLSQKQQRHESSVITNHQSQNQPTESTFSREVTCHGHTASTLPSVRFWSLPPWQRQPITMTLATTSLHPPETRQPISPLHIINTVGAEEMNRCESKADKLKSYKRNKWAGLWTSGSLLWKHTRRSWMRCQILLISCSEYTHHFSLLQVICPPHNKQVTLLSALNLNVGAVEYCEVWNYPVWTFPQISTWGYLQRYIKLRRKEKCILVERNEAPFEPTESFRIF